MGKTYRHPNKIRKIREANREFLSPKNKAWVRRKSNKLKDDLYDSRYE